MTDRKPAIALIVGANDKIFLTRLKKVTKIIDIKIFIINIFGD